MTTVDPAPVAASVLRHVERCWRKGKGPTQPKTFGNAARVEGTEDGTVYVTVATEGVAWRLRLFAVAKRLRVVVRVDAKALEESDA